MATVEATIRPQIRLHTGTFVNEPLTDFTKEENARKMRSAIEKVRGQLGREYDLIIGGQRLKTAEKIRSINPANPGQVVGIHQKAGKEHVEPAMKSALETFEHWKRTTVEEQKDTLHYIPLGVGAVIPPWNFPCAIMAGMTLASIVSGNTVVLKPSSDSPTIAAKFVELLEECGMPEGVVNFCPGAGASFGDAIVAHPKTRYIAFTGSREVGLRINKVAADNAPGQVWIKRTILEMGGKDAIVVDADADIDSAVEGVAGSAFGFQGQKCSACSRAIVDERIYDSFLQKLKARVEKIQVGDPAENAQMGAVINEGSMNSILEYIEQGKKDGRVITGGGRASGPGNGFYLQPTVIADIQPKSKLEQEEIFGPVLAVIKSKNYDHALQIANDTEFGLTGAVYTKSKDKIERAIEEFHEGNLYINRKCTGATVGCHPFGGFNMSGTDSKSGGPDYLYLFTQGKAVGKKTI
ncbi:MAG: L-glutamate gamma-semialdehyde dehydrogenase [Acidobacteria bacterium]|nr:MAG: L-glutamate gamma-semialdehyde dehydrogenase [Acidobacteriota bacterium]